MTTRVLVVGGAGYIGAHITLALLEENALEMAVMDDLSSGYRENVPEGVAFFHANMLDTAALDEVLREFRPTAIIQLAALKAAGDSMTDPVSYASHNLGGSMTLIHGALAAGVQQIVFSSTAAVYGEPEYLPLDENHPTNPTNFYGFTKLQIEHLLAWYAQLKGLRFASLRYFNAAGYDAKGRVRGLEKNPKNLVPIVMEVACGLRPHIEIFGDDYPTPDGTCVRDYIHVTDLADAHVRALRYLDCQTRLTCNLGTGNGHSVIDVIESTRRVTGRKVTSKVVGRRRGDPPSLWASNRLAQSALGWQPRHSQLDAMVASTWNTYQTVVAKESH